MSELKSKEYKRKDYKEYNSDIDVLSDSSDVFDIVIESMERTKTRPPVYNNDPEGFNNFRDMTISFIKEVRERNAEAENSKRLRLIPSVEMWALYLGITRQTINNYEHNYESYYKDFIQQFKNAIATIKKELAENGKINPMLHCFDFCNNYGYVNTNYFTLTTEPRKNDVYYLPSEEKEKLGLNSINKKNLSNTQDSNITDSILDEPLPYF